MWYHLAHLLVHLGKFLLEWSGEKNAQPFALSQGNSYSFERHMRSLAEKNSIPLVELKSDRATFQPSLKGRNFVTELFHQGSTITVSVFSNIRFPARCIPPEVSEMICGLNHPGDGFRLAPSDSPDCSVVIAERCGPAAELTPEAFIPDTQEMLLVIALLDTCIIERGFAAQSKGGYS